ncbi:MAG: hypothetical protein CM1200mP39_18580 [Dehalococcoidia bacterium]|nr:MAG: hypothetical protein CM1200mP39_18580 [Dehalococcoidia bacterium]
MAFAWKACQLVHSNAIVFAKDFALQGMGAGQPNRAISVYLAGRSAGENAKGCVMASDAFFPFQMELKTQPTLVLRRLSSLEDL